MRRWIFAVVAAVSVAPYFGCSRAANEDMKSPEAPMSRDAGDGWSVFNKKGEEVMRIWDKPGPLTSTALPAPGQKHFMHPFLSGSSMDPNDEADLGDILRQSHSFDEYVAKLKKAGYDVRPISIPR